MGPRSDERGNESASGDASVVRKLQWGRARMSAEIVYKQAQYRTRIYASMGPRSDERGNGFSPSQEAFLGVPLQWGRARMSAEIASRAEASAAAAVLQWGRARMSAEISA